MAYGGGDAAAAGVVESHHAAVAQRQLYLALALLTGHAAGYRAVYLVGKPVFAGHGFERQHVAHVVGELGLVIFRLLVAEAYGGVVHHRLGGVAKHVGHLQVYRFASLVVLEYEAMVAGGLADHIYRGALALSHTFHIGYILGIHHHTHALLALVAHDLLGREGLVAHGEGIDVDFAAGLLHKLREGVEVASGAMVVDRNHGILLPLGQGADHIGHALLHLGVGTLHGVELDGVGILPGLHRAYGAAAHADAVVVTTHHHYFLAGYGCALDGIFPGCVAHAAGKHYHLVIGIHAAVLVVLEGEQRAADERLAEFVAEVRGAVRGLDQDLGRGLIEPHAGIHHQLPVVLGAQTRVGGHVYGCAGDGERGLAAPETVADLAAGAGGSAIEGLHGGGEVVGLCLERDHGVEILHLEVVGSVGVDGVELVYRGTLEEGHIIFVSAHKAVGALLRGAFDQFEERQRFLLAVDDECAVEDLVAAVLRVDLREAEYLRVGEGAPQLLGEAAQIGFLLGAEGQTFLCVVGVDVADFHYRLGLAVEGEDAAVEPVVVAHEHLVEAGLLAVGQAGELLDAGDPFEAHVLGYFHCVGAPGGDHFTARTDETALYGCGAQGMCSRECPH